LLFFAWKNEHAAKRNLLRDLGSSFQQCFTQQSKRKKSGYGEDKKTHCFVCDRDGNSFRHDGQAVETETVRPFFSFFHLILPADAHGLANVLKRASFLEKEKVGSGPAPGIFNVQPPASTESPFQAKALM
jgi:hypothetical protein